MQLLRLALEIKAQQYLDREGVSRAVISDWLQGRSHLPYCEDGTYQLIPDWCEHKVLDYHLTQFPTDHGDFRGYLLILLNQGIPWLERSKVFVHSTWRVMNRAWHLRTVDGNLRRFYFPALQQKKKKNHNTSTVRGRWYNNNNNCGACTHTCMCQYVCMCVCVCGRQFVCTVKYSPRRKNETKSIKNEMKWEKKQKK